MKGKIAFAWFNNPGGMAQVSIYIEDELSHTQFLKVDMTPLDFASATLGSLGDVDCEFELHPSRVGMEYQHKVMEVTVPKYEFEERDAVTERAVKDAESDGWEGRVEDARNHHNFVRRDKDSNEVYRVVFVRWVKPQEGQA